MSQPVKHKLFPVMLIILAATNSFAAANTESVASERTEFFWQPNQDMNSARLGILFLSANEEMDTMADFKVSGLTEALSIAHGFSTNWAGAVQVSYSSVTADTGTSTATPYKFKSSGIHDILLAGSNTTPLDGFALYYGGILGISPGKRKVSSITSTGNEYSGGFSLQPYVGISTPINSQNIVGAKLDFNYKLKRDLEYSDGTTATVKGGHETAATAFYEFHSGQGVISPQLGISKTASETTTSAGTDSSSDALTSIVYKLEGDVFLTPAFKIGISWSGIRVPEIKLGTTLKVPAHTNKYYTFDLRYEF